jgi:hypothetical protein
VPSSLLWRDERATRRFHITTALAGRARNEALSHHDSARLGTMRSAEAITVEALFLPSDERAALVLRLAESLDEEHDADAEDAWAAAWYDERVSGLGERFLVEAEAAFARIDETPLAGSPWLHRRLPDGVRRMFLRSFPLLGGLHSRTEGRHRCGSAPSSTARGTG